MENKPNRKIGNDPAQAVNFLDQVELIIQSEGLSMLTEPGYRPVNLEEIEKGLIEQTERIEDYKILLEKATKIEEQIKGMDLRPNEGSQIVKKLRLIEKEIEELEWKGHIEEQVEETRRKKYEAAVTNNDKKLAGVSRIEQLLRDRVEDSIYMQIRQSTQDVKEPSAKLKKIQETLKNLILGDQTKERELMIRRLDDIPAATDNIDLKKKINEMRVLKIQFKDSAKMSGLALQIEESKMITRLEEISMGNGVDFSAKLEYRDQSRMPGNTFDKMATAVEKVLDRAINKNRDKEGGGGSRGMDISYAQAAEHQTMGKAVTGDGASGSRDCFRWVRQGECMFGKDCRYDHIPSKKGTSDNRRGRGRNRSSSRSRDRDDRSRSRDNRGGGSTREYDSSRGRGGGNNNERRGSSSNSRDRDRFDNGGRNFDRRRDDRRRDDASKSPEGRGRDDRGGSNGGRNNRDRRSSSSSSSSSRYSSSSSGDEDSSSSRSSGASTVGRGGTPKKTIPSRNSQK